MNAPLVWIVFPALLAVVLYFVRRWKRAMVLGGIAAAGALAWLAWQIPIGAPIALGPWPAFGPLEINDTLFVLGRRFTLVNAMRPVLAMLYLGIAFWFGGALIAGVSRLFVPFGLGVAALLTASLAVEPFLYAALLLELAALLCIPILSPPGRPIGRGVQRFLAFQTLGMPFILLTGWMLTGVEANPANPALAIQAGVMISLGFAFLAAIFPFHTWLPMLGEEAHPYAAAFVFFALPTMMTLFALGFLERYVWLRSQPILFLALQSVGLLMVILGGVWAALQRHLGRILGYAAVMEIGLSLLALSLGREQGLPFDPTLPGFGGPLLGIFFAQILPRSLALGLWAVALAVLQNHTGGLRFREVQGAAHRLPFACAGLLLAHFSLAGFPLLAGFPVRLALWTGLAQESPTFALLALVGNGGLMAAGLRTLTVLILGAQESGWSVSETRLQRLLFGLGLVQVLALGLMPQWFLPGLTAIARSFALPTP